MEQFERLSYKPEYGTDEYKNWIEQEDFIGFLQTIPKAADLILYASIPFFTFIYGVLVPKRLVSPPNINDLDQWSCNPYSTWGISISYGKRKRVWLSPPLDNTGSETIARGEQVLFARHFDGRQEEISVSLELSLFFKWV